METSTSAASRSAAVLLLPFAFAGACAAADPPPSLTRDRCYVCHADREPGAGPAFADIAAYYRNSHDAVSTIASNIRSGMRSGGPWHMPPHPEVSEAEARAMARYIMSLRDPPSAK
ncbi:MAG: c-type cytochrome [Burkholderiales bacterium]